MSSIFRLKIVRTYLFDLFILQLLPTHHTFYNSLSIQGRAKFLHLVV
jgi:hypothetical protein